MTNILCSPPLGVPKSALSRVGLVLFMHVARCPGGHQRRVATLWEGDGLGERNLRFQWDARTDTFRQVGELRQPEQLSKYVQFLRHVLESGEVEMEAVRQKVLDFYQDGAS